MHEKDLIKKNDIAFYWYWIKYANLSRQIANRIVNIGFENRFSTKIPNMSNNRRENVEKPIREREERNWILLVFELKLCLDSINDVVRSDPLGPNEMIHKTQHQPHTY